MNRLPSLATMERALFARDATYDGAFYAAVRTTGVFCRPSCPARKPLPRNVVYFATPQEALAAGFRPCKRCHPLSVQEPAPPWAALLLEVIETDPTARITDADLRRCGLDPVRVRRFFLRQYGITFHAYCRGQRMGRALSQIRAGVELDEVALGNGYDSHSGFREAFTKMFGQAPGRAATTDCITVAMAETPLGPLMLGATSAGLCLAAFAASQPLEAQAARVGRQFGFAVVPGSTPLLEQAKDELGRYFARTSTHVSVPLLPFGDVEQGAVWARVRQIS